MIELLLGIACGVALSLFFSFGPAFFALIQNSLHYGYRRAVPFAFGVSLSDVIVVFLMLTALRRVDMFEVLHNVYVASVASVVMAGMGVYTFRKKVKADKMNHGVKFTVVDPPRRRKVLGRGFLLNFINPSIWIYWVSVIALLSGELDIPTNRMYLFFGGVLAATLGMDILKCKLASMLHSIITADVITTFNRATGIILIGFALYLLISMIVYQVDPVARQREQDNSPQSTEMIKRIHEGVGHQSTAKKSDTISII